MSALDTDLFERAREAADIEKVAGVVLYKAGKRRRGECPLCGASKGKKAGGAFSVDPEAKVFWCHLCEQGGDVINLEHRLRSSGSDSMADAARRLLGHAAAKPESAEACERRARRRAAEAKAAEESEAWKAEVSARTWREATPARGTLVEIYLRARGLFGPVLDRMLDQVRFHPRAYHSGHPRFGTFLPAMVALPVVWVDGKAVAPGGVHCTYLAADGRGKTGLEGAKKMWGPQGVVMDEVFHPAGVWLAPPHGDGPLDVGEGMESAAGLSVILGAPDHAPRRTFATLSLARMQGGELKDKNGLVDVRAITPDPKRPPAVWPEDPARPWGRVNIGVDHDMPKPMPVTGFRLTRNKRRQPVKMMRSGDERSRVCAVLATAAWTGALAQGSGTTVAPLLPPPGRDFSDELFSRANAADAVGRCLSASDFETGAQAARGRAPSDSASTSEATA